MQTINRSITALKSTMDVLTTIKGQLTASAGLPNDHHAVANVQAAYLALQAAVRILTATVVAPPVTKPAAAAKTVTVAPVSSSSDMPSLADMRALCSAKGIDHTKLSGGEMWTAIKATKPAAPKATPPVVTVKPEPATVSPLTAPAVVEAGIVSLPEAKKSDAQVRRETAIAKLDGLGYKLGSTLNGKVITNTMMPATLEALVVKAEADKAARETTTAALGSAKVDTVATDLAALNGGQLEKLFAKLPLEVKRAALKAVMTAK